MDWEDKRALFNEYVEAYRKENEVPLGHVYDDPELTSWTQLTSSCDPTDMSQWIENGENMDRIQILSWNRNLHKEETFEELLWIRGREIGGHFHGSSLGWESVVVFDRLCRRPVLLARPDLAIRIHELV